MDTAAAKQQIVERLKQANNVLVTVSNNPSVDQLAACIGMTLFLNKLKKHATAVFSGEVPSTLEFLQPGKTLEANTDSLRDFIISLDKAKADKLRYKVEDKFVRIYITPYRTSLNENDLVFSQGDFNVEVVLALGVRDKNQLDAAITQHGRILHDATVVSVNSGADNASAIGQINWQESTSSSLCEMLVSISEAFGTGLIDNQMATAFLTGIVAETQRFSNSKTSPKVMTMSAQLMAAGANQQLIVSKLEPPPPPPEADKPVAPKTPPPKTPPSDTLNISHDEDKTQEVELNPAEIHIDKYGNILSSEDIQAALNGMKSSSSVRKAEALASMPQVTMQAAPAEGELPEPIAETTPAPQPETAEPVAPEPAKEEEKEKPAADESNKQEEPEARRHLLDPADSKSTTNSFSADTELSGEEGSENEPVDLLGEKPNAHDVIMRHPTFDVPGKASTPQVELSSETSTFPEPAPVGTPTFPTPTVDSARSAVNSAISSTSFDPANNPVDSLNSQQMGELHSGTASEDELAKPAPPPVPPPLPEATTKAAAPVTAGSASELAKPL